MKVIILVTLFFSAISFAGILPTSRGGTGANLTPSNGAAVYSTSSGMAITSGNTVFNSFGIATATSIVIGAGTTLPNGAQIYITPGSSLATIQKNAVESDGTHVYWTDSSGTRRRLDN